MITYIIPTSTDKTVPDYKQSTRLGTRDYILRFYWNQRAGQWHVDLADQDGSPLAAGVPINLGYPLFRGFTDARMPSGAVIAVDLRGTGQLPNINELGDRVLLLYIEP